VLKNVQLIQRSYICSRAAPLVQVVVPVLTAEDVIDTPIINLEVTINEPDANHATPQPACSTTAFGP